ncbi:MAG: crosslink repair DNA glycosylase YcaQ family protein [Actinomycetota bacterium]
MTALAADATRIACFRLRTGHLDQRLDTGDAGLRRAAHAGLQDSMPRAAVLSLHARVRGVDPTVLESPALTQVWGPGFSAYVVASDDTAVFTLGRYPDGGKRRTAADTLTARLRDVLDDRPREYREVGAELGIDHNQLRYAALTGTIRLHWEGSGKPRISRLPDPTIEPLDARCELARRFLHVYGPASPTDFAAWAGVSVAHARNAFAGIEDETIDVTTPIGAAQILAADEEALRTAGPGGPMVRLLPSGDAFTLWTGDQRSLLLPDPTRRDRLWTPRVWPGALLVDERLVGTWRRSGDQMAIETWTAPDAATVAAVEAEVATLPLEEQPLIVSWQSME